MLKQDELLILVKYNNLWSLKKKSLLLYQQRY